MKPSLPSPTVTTTTLPTSPTSGACAEPLAVQLHRGRLLRDLPDQEVPRLALGLLVIAKLLGLHQLPDEPQLLALADFLRRRFPDFTEAELRHAVERWAAGELAPGLQTFGTLSLDFVGHLLAAYRSERQRHLRESQLRDARAERDREPVQEPADDWHHRLVVEYLHTHRELPPIADWQACWRHLRRSGELPSLIPDQLDAYADQVRRELEQEQRTAKLTGRRPPEPIPTTGEVWHAYLRQHRALAFYRHLLTFVK